MAATPARGGASKRRRDDVEGDEYDDADDGFGIVKVDEEEEGEETNDVTPTKVHDEKRPAAHQNGGFSTSPCAVSRPFARCCGCLGRVRDGHRLACQPTGRRAEQGRRAAALEVHGAGGGGHAGGYAGGRDGALTLTLTLALTLTLTPALTLTRRELGRSRL